MSQILKNSKVVEESVILRDEIQNRIIKQEEEKQKKKNVTQWTAVRAKKKNFHLQHLTTISKACYSYESLVESIFFFGDMTSHVAQEWT